MTWSWQWLKDLDGRVATLANWLSIISVLASVYAAVTIARVRREIVGRAALPSVIGALETSSRNLTAVGTQAEPEWHQVVDLEFARCEVYPRAVIAIRNAARRPASDLLRDIEAYRRLAGSAAPEEAGTRRDQAWRIYVSLNGLIEELKRITLWQQMGG